MAARALRRARFNLRRCLSRRACESGDCSECGRAGATVQRRFATRRDVKAFLTGVDVIQVIETIVRKWPRTADVLDEISRLMAVVSDLEDEAFFEPVSLIDWPQEGRRGYASFTAFHFVGGLRHASGSARARMTMLEEAALNILASTGVYPAAVLVRSHMEAAGLAAMALVDGTAALEKQKIEDVADVVLALQLGTSMRREAKKNERVNECLLLSETNPLRAGRLIEALDRYAAAGEEVGRYFRASYAVLCEYAHAAMRVSRRFARVLETHEEGWLIQYDRREVTDSDEVQMILQMLHRSMQVGHSCAEMLRNIEVVEVGEDSVGIVPPTEEVGKFVWTQLLQRDPDEPGARNGA